MHHFIRYRLFSSAAAVTLAAWVMSAASADVRVAVPSIGSQSNFPSAAAATPSPATLLHVTIALNSAASANIDKMVAEQYDPQSSLYHHWLTPRQFGAMFGAPADTISTVTRFLAGSGFKNIAVTANRLFVTGQTTVAGAEAAFHIQITGRSRGTVKAGDGNPHDNRDYFYAPDRQVTVPASVAPCVHDISGLSTFVRMVAQQNGVQMPVAITPPTGGTPSPFAGPLAPADVTQVYELTAFQTAGTFGSGQTVGIFSPTEMTIGDVSYFATYYGVPAGYTLEETKVDGGATDFNGQLEACLDGEVIVGQDQRSTINYYESPNNGSLDVWNQIATDDPGVISDSWSFDEAAVYGSSGGPAYIASFHTILAQLASQGEALYNSTGDNGADNTGSGAFSIGYPGADPDCTAVGGTSLTGQINGAWASEEAWDSSGGGLSVVFPMPAWQYGPGVQNSYSNGMRQTPDISACADPNSPGYWVRSAGTWYQVGGTSASTPLWASANTLFNEAAKQKTGNLNSALYNIGRQLNTYPDLYVYHDMVAGDNGYSTTPFWDYVSGWGSARFAKLYADLYDQIDLVPWAPPAPWAGVVSLHLNPGDPSQPAQLNDSTTYLIATAVADIDFHDATQSVEDVQIDGTDNFVPVIPIPSEYYVPIDDAVSHRFSAGTHTIKLIANANYMVPESNTSNNSAQITVKILPSIKSLYFNNSTAYKGGTVVPARIDLTAAAPSSPGSVTISSSNSSVAAVPKSEPLNTGKNYKLFNITTRVVTKTSYAVIKVWYAGTFATRKITVTP
ncbi:MAG: S8/S53 family peptidase [Armatimonadetes bacterium]|nr:S8/S53 family peptidase [Armatimonadota bacterium]MDE2207530.1 S8/S53 family peptidase [Armatimonadota bacterium]